MTDITKNSPAQNREHAYKTWRASGQCITETVRELEKQGFKFSRKTITEWCDKYNWKDRAARAEAEEAKLSEELSETTILQDLSLLRKRYKQKFEKMTEGDPVDNQTAYAFANVCRAIYDIQTKESKNGFHIPESEIPEVSEITDGVETLKNAIRKQIGIMQANPGKVNLKGVQDIIKALDLLELKSPTPKKETVGGLSDKTVEMIEKKVLGLDK